MADNVLYELAGGIATIALDQPETRNGLSDEVLDDLIEGFEIARDVPPGRGVVGLEEVGSGHGRTLTHGRHQHGATR